MPAFRITERLGNGLVNDSQNALSKPIPLVPALSLRCNRIGNWAVATRTAYLSADRAHYRGAKIARDFEERPKVLQRRCAWIEDLR